MAKVRNYHKHHKMLWNYLARTGARLKLDYFEAKGINDFPFGECYACSVGNKTGEYEGRTCLCPITWVENQQNGVKDENMFCLRDNTLFSQWLVCLDPKKRKALAKQIADLPWEEKKNG